MKSACARLVVIVLPICSMFTGCLKREAPVPAGIRTQTFLLGNRYEPADLDPHITTAVGHARERLNGCDWSRSLATFFVWFNVLDHHCTIAPSDKRSPSPSIVPPLPPRAAGPLRNLSASRGAAARRSAGRAADTHAARVSPSSGGERLEAGPAEPQSL